MRRYRALLSGDPRFALPAPVDDLVESTVLPMDYLTGAPIETLAGESQALRDKASGALLDLVMRELFEFGFMQTDPNFANYKWRHEDARIVLLEFGAARPARDRRGLPSPPARRAGRGPRGTSAGTPGA